MDKKIYSSIIKVGASHKTSLEVVLVELKHKNLFITNGQLRLGRKAFDDLPAELSLDNMYKQTLA